MDVNIIISITIPGAAMLLAPFQNMWPPDTTAKGQFPPARMPIAVETSWAVTGFTLHADT
jgi:hypothetical protein